MDFETVIKAFQDIIDALLLWKNNVERFDTRRASVTFGRIAGGYIGPVPAWSNRFDLGMETKAVSIQTYTDARDVIVNAGQDNEFAYNALPPYTPIYVEFSLDGVDWRYPIETMSDSNNEAVATVYTLPLKARYFRWAPKRFTIDTAATVVAYR